MLNTEFDEVPIVVETYPYMYTYRYVTYCKTVYGEMNAVFNYSLKVDDFRKAWCCTEGPFDEKLTTFHICTATYIDNRFFCLAIAPNSEERTCYFKVNAKVLISTVSVPLAYTYNDDRYICLSQSILSQRITVFRLGVHSEISSWIERVNKTCIGTTEICVSFTYEDERFVYLNQNPISQRYVIFPLTIYDEITAFVTSPQMSVINTPSVVLRLDDLITERPIYLCFIDAFSERFSIFVHVPNSERFTFIKILSYDERIVCLNTYRPFTLTSFSVSESIPETSERTCILSFTIFYSEIKTFLETRPMYLINRPSTISDINTLMSSQDTSVNISVNSDRPITITGENITQQSSNDIASGKVVLVSSNPVYTISMVDSMGATISTTSTPIVKTLLSSTIFDLNITLT